MKIFLDRELLIPDSFMKSKFNDLAVGSIFLSLDKNY